MRARVGRPINDDACRSRNRVEFAASTATSAEAAAETEAGPGVQLLAMAQPGVIAIGRESIPVQDPDLDPSQYAGDALEAVAIAADTAPGAIHTRAPGPRLAVRRTPREHIRLRPALRNNGLRLSQTNMFRRRHCRPGIPSTLRLPITCRSPAACPTSKCWFRQADTTAPAPFHHLPCPTITRASGLRQFHRRLVLTCISPHSSRNISRLTSTTGPECHRHHLRGDGMQQGSLPRPRPRLTITTVADTVVEETVTTGAWVEVADVAAMAEVVAGRHKNYVSCSK